MSVKPSQKKILSLVGHLIIQWLLAGMQSALWPSVLGTPTIPLIALTSIVYFSIYRSAVRSTVYIYCLSFLLASFSWLPWGLVAGPLLIVSFTTQFLRRRLFWNRLNYFLLICSLAMPFYVLSLWGISTLIEVNGIERVSLLRMILESVLILPLGVALYPLYRFVDELFDQPEINESEVTLW